MRIAGLMKYTITLPLKRHFVSLDEPIESERGIGTAQVIIAIERGILDSESVCIVNWKRIS